ncbi:SurA N-terminal domain-containing protein [Aquabacterium sp. CECT 9606]|uniref:SurA N-terminal domain-containing protein n=1 Tax=Aquabacterium sp. CECT 9606 TaxID=2845822 RepID=UPI001EF9B9F0|nr:SurA N-terminal domain-containing protein [Aquabacterium sp. CECT 9606]CAH0353506.1 Chaperone SurA [Aquabacterium sp. CECT 9606]
MFDFVRKHTRVMQGLLVLLIVPSFVLVGVQSYSKFMDDDGIVAKVAGKDITQTEWDQAHRRMVERVRSQQPDVDPSTFDKPEFKKQVLESLVREYVLSVAARDLNLRAADARLVRMFATDQQYAFLRNPDGSLNKELLQAQGMTAAQFAERLRLDMSVNQVLGGVAGTGLTSTVSNREAVEALFQVREVQWMKFEPKNYVAQLNPTVDQLKAFYNSPANTKDFMVPEKADVEYVVLDLDVLKKGVSVPEEELRRSYQENITRYTQPEERRASHILIKAEKSAPAAQKQAAQAKAEQLLAQLKKDPAQFAELAKKNSDDPGSAVNGGDLDFFGRGAMAKPFEDAAFSLKQGDISGVVETDYGYHIITVTGLRGGQPQPFEAVRAQIEDDARKQLAQRQYAEAAESFTNKVYEQPDSLKPVADDLKLTVQKAADVLRSPGTKDQGLLGNARLLEALFDASNRAKNRNTEAIEVGPNKLVSARIVKYTPASKPPFEQMQTQVRERWIAAESVKAARQDADQKMAMWKQAPDKAQLPAPVQMSRRLVFSQPPAVLDAALRVPEKQLPAWVVVDIGHEGSALLKVNKVLPLQITPQEVQETEAQFAGYWGKAEADAYFNSLKKKYKVEYLNDGKKLMEESAKPGEAQKTASAL